MEESIINKKKKKITILTISGLFAIVFVLIGVTYAFFNYTRTGSANTIRVGKIAFNTQQGQAINLTNVFPVDVSEGIPNDSNVGSVTINVTGDTTYAGGVEYLVTATNVSNTVGSKQLPISIDVSYSANGTGKTIGTEVTGNTDYFTVRGGNTSYYKVLAENTITGNDNLVVGYIAPGATGIDGNIVIRAYIDAAKVAISDTYDGTESDNNGTTTNWVNNRTVFTTTEWNSLQTNGVSFRIKVEANEGTWVQIKPKLYNVIAENATLDNANSTYVQNVSTSDVSNAKATFLNNVESQGKVIKLAAGIDFSEKSSDTNGKGVYLRSGTENSTYPIYYYRGDVYNNNVAFAGFCWLAVRTTDTGGVKLLYNGVQDEDGTCMPVAGETSSETSGETSGNVRRTGDQTLITVDGTKEHYFSGNELYKSPAYVGYMYGTVYEYQSKKITGTSDSLKFGSGISYSNGTYTLTGSENGLANTRHYTCFNATGICNGDAQGKVYYVIFSSYYNNNTTYYFVELTSGDDIQNAITKMQTNTTNSYAKTKIDSWYQSNMTSYTSLLEDTVWCNDRSISDFGAWSSTGTLALGRDMEFSPYTRWESGTPSLSCTNVNDSFTVSNTRGNRKLTYPVGMLTIDELMLAGNGSYMAYTNVWKAYWSLSPGYFYGHGSGYYASVFTVYNDGTIGSNVPNYASGLRPAVSLKPGTTIESNGADGTAAKPYRVS